ncbi:phosphatidylinositol binding, partial [Tieghemiomyces parasiticus]
DQRRRASNASLNAGRTGAGSPAGPGMAAHGMFNKAAPPSVSGRLNRKLGDGIDDAVSSPPTGTTLHTINSDTTAAAASIPPSSSEPSLLLSAAGAPTLDTPPSDKTTSAFATTHSISTAPRKVEVPLLKSPTSNPPRRSSLASTPMASSVSAPPPSGFPRPDTSSTTGTVSHKALRPEEIELLIETFFALMDEVFDLKDTKQWLRRKALAVFKQLLRQSYASTISTVFVDTVTKYTEPALLADRIDQLTTSFWPNGTWYATPITDDPSSPSLPVVRTEEQKEATKLEARVLFVNHMPEALQRMVGEYNGVMGMTRLFELLQRPELVRPIAIKLLDSICKLVLSELQD